MIVFSSFVINKFYSVFGFKNKDSSDIEIFTVSSKKNDINKIINKLTDIKAEKGYIVGYNIHSSIYQSILDDRILVSSFQENELIDYLNNFKRYYATNTENKYIDLMKINGMNGVHIDFLKYKYGMDSVFRDIEGETETHLRDSIQRTKEDIEFISKLYADSRSLLNTRFVISRDYGFDCMNWSDARIGEEILLSVYSQKIGLNKDLVRRKVPSEVSSIDFSKLVLPYISFDSKAFKDVLSYYMNTIYNGTFTGKVIKVGNTEFSFGLGGLHQCKRGVYESDDNYVIVDFDAKAYLPKLISNNCIKPLHLSNDFCDVYKNHIIKVREEEESKNNPNKEIVKIYKNAASCVFGLTGSPDSWLYNKEFLYKVTINSQLTIAMLIEKLTELDVKFIQTNTDGGTILISRSHLPKFKEIYTWWKSVTNMSLRVSLANKMAVYNNNSYIMEMQDGSLNSIGALSLDSFPSVITNAVYHHIFKNGNCQEYINDCEDIKQFLIPIKETESSKIGYSHKGEIYELGGAVRYYVSTKESVSIGRINNGKFTPEIKGNSAQVIVDVIPNFSINEYNVDKMYYTAKALSIISDILGGFDNQCKLF